MQVFGLAFCGLMTVSVHYGYGMHTTSLDIDDAEHALVYNMSAFVVGLMAFALAKLGVAALLDRIMNPSFVNRCLIWGLAGLVAVINVVNVFVYVTMCKPVDALWKIHKNIQGDATCRDVWILINFATFNGGKSLPFRLLSRVVRFTDCFLFLRPAISAFADLYLATYPAFVVFRLQMPLRKKVGLTVALGLGYVYVEAPFLSSSLFARAACGLICVS